MCESQDLICQTLSDELPFGDRPFVRAAPHSSLVASGLGRARGQAPQPLSGAPKAQGLTARTNPKPPWVLAECDLF